MKKAAMRIIAAITAAVMTITALSALSSAEAEPECKDAYPVPKLSGDARQDLIAVAMSQLGYREASDESSAYARWYGQPFRAWCGIFVVWCAEKAGISKFVIPHTTHIIDFYASRGRYFYAKEGIPGGKCDLAEKYRPATISIADAEPGDILLWETNGDISDGPDHTAIFLSYSDGRIEDISGNCSNSVKICHDSPEELHAIIKPDYLLKETPLTKDLSEVGVRGSKYAEYTGKTVYPKFDLYDEEIGYPLVKNKDYKVKVTDAVKPGSEATATFTGIGNYTGKVEVKYNVWLADPVLKVKKGSTKVKLVWDTVKGAQRYSLWRSEDGGKTFKEILHLDKDRTSCVIKYDRNKSVTYQLRAYYQRDKGWWIYSRSENVTVGKK